MLTRSCTVSCNYCGEPAELVTGSALFPSVPRVWNKSFWRCVPCDARVGCHPGTIAPLGSLANGALRRARQRAHSAFDPLWKHARDKGRARVAAYGWLAEQLGMSPADCHIGMFDEATCARVVELCLKAKFGGPREDARALADKESKT